MKRHEIKQNMNLHATLHGSRSYLVALIATCVLSACNVSGGGSGADNPPPRPPPPPESIRGIANVGYPIANGTIQIVCASGAALNTTTDNHGIWQATIGGQTLPCVVEVNGGTVNGLANTIAYHSVATSFGTANVTPLSDLLLANLLGTATPNVWFAGLDPATLTAITSDLVHTALTKQCASLSGLSLLCTTNPITTVFSTVGDNVLGHMLSALQIAMLNSYVTYVDLLNDAAAASYASPPGNFNTALTNAYAATTAPISAVAIATTQSLTVGIAMTSFSPLYAIGGTPPYSYSYAGVLPAGLSFNANTGVVTGIPQIIATENLVFSVKDANNAEASTTNSVNFTVVAASTGPIATANTTAQSLTVGRSMGSFLPLTVSGGSPPYAFSYQGALPAGLSFNSSTGMVSGTPTAIYVTSGVIFSVSDNNNAVASTTSTVSFTVQAAGSVISAIAITTAQNLVTGTAMTSFSPLLASGGTPPYRYSYTGTLPPGLSFSTSTGAVTGTPNAVYASAALIFSVKDTNNVTASTTSTVRFTVSASTSGGSGVLSVSNAPVSVGGAFNGAFIRLTGTPSRRGITWGEGIIGINGTPGELLTIVFDTTTNKVSDVLFFRVDSLTALGSWGCSGPFACSGIALDRITGNVTFANTSLVSMAGNSLSTQSIELNGTLTFTPF